MNQYSVPEKRNRASALELTASIPDVMTGYAQTRSVTKYKQLKAVTPDEPYGALPFVHHPLIEMDKLPVLTPEIWFWQAGGLQVQLWRSRPHIELAAAQTNRIRVINVYLTVDSFLSYCPWRKRGVGIRSRSDKNASMSLDR